MAKALKGNIREGQALRFGQRNLNDGSGQVQVLSLSGAQVEKKVRGPLRVGDEPNSCPGDYGCFNLSR